MARNKGGLGPGAMKMGGMGAKPSRPPTAMSRPPAPRPPMGAGPSGPSALAGSPPPVGGGMKKGGKVEKHKHAKGGIVEGGDSKGRHHPMGAFK